MAILNTLLSFVLPKNCIFCGGRIYTNASICPGCIGSLPYLGGDDYRRGLYFSRCVSLFNYEGKIANAVKAFKYRGKYKYADTLGAMLAALIKRQGEEFDIITYVPQSAARAFARGYNPSRLLALEASKRLAPIPCKKLMRKVRHTRRQVGKSAVERRENLTGSFALAKNADVVQKRILIIDDVVTTGATLEECALTLVRAGAAEVTCATLAKTRR